jgi:hypothetical protein
MRAGCRGTAGAPSRRARHGRLVGDGCAVLPCVLVGWSVRAFVLDAVRTVEVDVVADVVAVGVRPAAVEAADPVEPEAPVSLGVLRSLDGMAFGVGRWPRGCAASSRGNGTGLDTPGSGTPPNRLTSTSPTAARHSTNRLRRPRCASRARRPLSSTKTAPVVRPWGRACRGLWAATGVLHHVMSACGKTIWGALSVTGSVWASPARCAATPGRARPRRRAPRCRRRRPRCPTRATSHRPPRGPPA